MRGRRTGAATMLAAGLLAGCGIGPSDVLDAGPAPTGVAPGTTLYFVDGSGALRPSERMTGRLGDIGGAVELLLTGPGLGEAGEGLHTEVAPVPVTRTLVTASHGLVTLTLPLTSADVTPRGIDQIVCTALAVHVVGGGSADDTSVVLRFTIDPPTEPRSCPVLG